ncbi:MAG: tRNA pseudouridine(55) synthase TruB [Candidatus Tokpelaia sp.]|nr:MAG: tRNA pseudouridine(55) synthase TruB [Candidatus Tokpelaia sp.]KAA6205338.1 MAG: tRNA pseudouridine(55) synthase TruB [Candidatus Tokpelaia sp.]
MARHSKRKGRPVAGWVILDKPKGMGSTEAVAKVKWLYNADKAGHAGTLDPLASGLLPIALGEATKTVPYVMEGTKVYRFTVAWGEERATDDLEGEITHKSDKRPNEADILALLPKYTGIILQTPPQFSAIKIGGERAYDIARNGEAVAIPPREVEIDVLDLMEITPEGHAVFEVECGKGTYVRSLARDMGRDMGCYGHVVDLRRIEVAPFSQEDFVSLEALEQASPRAQAQKRLEAEAAARAAEAAAAEAAKTGGKNRAERPRLPAAELQRLDFSPLDALLIETGAALECLAQYPIEEAQAVRVRSGNPIILRGRAVPLDESEACVTHKGKVLALGAIEQGTFHPKRVFTA